MVGPWPLAPHHDHLQYIHHVHLMQWGQNRGVTRNLVFGATQTELDCWLSSPQPLKSIGNGSQGLRDYEAEKGLIPGIGCVDVLEVRLALV